MTESDFLRAFNASLADMQCAWDHHHGANPVMIISQNSRRLGIEFSSCFVESSTCESITLVTDSLQNAFLTGDISLSDKRACEGLTVWMKVGFAEGRPQPLLSRFVRSQ